MALLTSVLLRGSAIAAAAGAAASWALLVVPTDVHFWGITVARDLPAHLLALGALAAACGGRFGLAGLALGAACSIRPDAVLYSLSLGAVALVVRPAPRALVRGSLAFAAGIAPLLAYNTITQGHPLAFTQGMEFRQLMSTAPGPPVAPASLAASLPIVSGGGFRLRNLPQVLPQNLRYLAAAFGAFLVPAVGALVCPVRRRTLVAAALAPYLAGSIFFYSCWGHGDARYLVGAVLVLLVAAAIGTTAWCVALVDASRPPRRRAALLALGLAVVVAAPHVFPEQPPRRPLEIAVGAGALLAGGAALAPALAATAAAVAPFVPAAAFAGVAVTRIVNGSGARDPFQAPQVARARESIEALVPAGARGDHHAGARPAGGEHHALHARRSVLRGGARGSRDHARGRDPPPARGRPACVSSPARRRPGSVAGGLADRGRAPERDGALRLVRRSCAHHRGGAARGDACAGWLSPPRGVSRAGGGAPPPPAVTCRRCRGW